jgi:phosphatidylethanolamine-binding protein (PEBP) family uncharacterized protein
VSLRELYRCDLVHCFRREDRTSDLEALSRRGVTISVDNDDDISELDIAADGLASLHRRKANVKRERNSIETFRRLAWLQRPRSAKVNSMGRMRQRTSAAGSTLLAALFLAVGVAGCGGSNSASSSPTTAATAAALTGAVGASSTGTASTSTAAGTTEKVPTEDIPVTSPVSFKPLSARYTCAGADISPPLRWSEIPRNTAEIDLFVFNVLPVHGKLFASWAVAGLKPGTRELSAGRLPAGAIVGRNGYGQARYSLCPSKRAKAGYVVQLYALPRMVPTKPGFDADALNKVDFHISESIGRLYF